MSNLIPALETNIRLAESLEISAERKEALAPFIAFMQKKYNEKKAINLNFICTHNSRRSQFAQIWAKTAAFSHGIAINSYSGGVEVTAFNERAVASMQRMGFGVKVKKDGENPTYEVFFSETADPVIAFSKVYDDKANADAEFAAIMTCSHADENCPVIPGAEARIPVRYEDPKAFDGKEEESAKYDERSLQIASEMFYVFSQIKK